MKRDFLKFLCGFTAAASFGHITYAAATARGIISVPLWRGREWGAGKMLAEAAVYGAISVALGYLGWRSAPRPATPPRTWSGGGDAQA